MTKDEEHLNLLGIFHYVLGGLMIPFGLVFVTHIVLGIVFLTRGDPEMPAEGGLIFLVMGCVAVTVCETLAGLLLAAGRCLRRRRHYKFCFAVAIASCLVQPLGMLLGIFTLLVLVRDSTKALFAAPPAQGPVPA